MAASIAQTTKKGEKKKKQKKEPADSKGLL
jgi:hypothetical protein